MPDAILMPLATADARAVAAWTLAGHRAADLITIRRAAATVRPQRRVAASPAAVQVITNRSRPAYERSTRSRGPPRETSSNGRTQLEAAASASGSTARDASRRTAATASPAPGSRPTSHPRTAP